MTISPNNFLKKHLAEFSGYLFLDRGLTTRIDSELCHFLNTDGNEVYCERYYDMLSRVPNQEVVDFLSDNGIDYVISFILSEGCEIGVSEDDLHVMVLRFDLNDSQYNLMKEV